MDNFFLPEVIKSNNKDEFQALKKCNDNTSEYKLSLSDSDIKRILSTRNQALSKNGRVEINSYVIENIIEAFADSPYIFQDNYADTIEGLVEVFYEYKNETMDCLSDDEMISVMKEFYDGYCNGSIELLEGKVLYRIAQNIRSGVKDYMDISDEKDQ